ncbi:MAG: hypothetical protein PG981_000512 [Wolbachia endosymbiont of Ctenocephalides orientis wCori]|nr:MAG: hypothetical protein PG981_000512 [Wolbachia endosymbiont of Ctenocephalides orientis wCori]
MLSVSKERLFSAIDNADLKEFAAALENGADVNAFDDVGNTPLMNIISAWAIDGDNEEMYKGMVDLLLSSTNINVNVQNREQSNTAFTWLSPLKT